MKKRPLLVVTLLVIMAIVLAGWSTQPAPLDLPAESPRLPSDLDAYLADSEAAEHEEYGLVPGTEKRIRWFAGRGARTDRSLVYLHGFSATRQEVAPLGEMVADALGANLFETRLSAHGRERDALTGVRAEEWLEDTAEALAIGAAIGNSTVLMSTSTGGTLSLAMLQHPLMQGVDVLIMMSPNVVLRDKSSEILTWPGGPFIAKLAVGDTRSWEPANELQQRYWTTSYPMQSAVELMRLVKFARNVMPGRAKQQILTIAAPDDAVVDSVASRERIAAIDSRRNEHLEFRGSGDLSRHVLAGDILSPASNATLAKLIAGFIEGT